MTDSDIAARREAEGEETKEGYLRRVCPTMLRCLLEKGVPVEVASEIMEFTSKFYVGYEALLMSSHIGTRER